MLNVKLFVDGSVNPVQQIALGAMWHSCNELLEDLDSIKNELIFTKFNSNKSTFVEVSTAICAIKWVKERYNDISKLTVYTDCQSLVDLVHRRKEKLVAANFKTKNGKYHNHQELYKELFKTIENLNIEIIKVKGHTKNPQTVIEKIFARVDQEVRKKLREASSLS